MPTEYINVHPYYYKDDVYEAIRSNTGVVALESTVIAHGLPRPDNYEVAKQCEEVVRAKGAVPATIAVLDGRILIGCGDEELARLAYGADVRKLSVRDLAPAVALGWDGATTVSGTIDLISHLQIRMDDAYEAYDLGSALTIQVFATGGVGGVHRGWEKTLDISADLPAIAKNDVITVCAGAKSILDLPATLEWLETAGVPVLGWGTEQFPAFYTRESGLKLDLQVNNADEVATIANARWTGSGGGLLLTAPLPAEHEVPGDEIEAALQQALAEAEKRGIRGRELTPFLLGTLREATGGRSLIANRALLLNNAAIGAEVAVALSKYRTGE